jgi:hypothetical protein
MKPAELGGRGGTLEYGCVPGSCPKADFGTSAYSAASAATVFVSIYTLCMM